MGERVKQVGKKYRGGLVFAVTALLSILLLLPGISLAKGEAYFFGSQSKTTAVTAKVEQIWSKGSQPYGIEGADLELVTIYFTAALTSGESKGSVVWAEQISDPLMAMPMQEVQAGDRVTLILFERTPEEEVWVMQEYDRSGAIFGLIGCLVLLLFLFGGKKGTGIVLSLALTCTAIFLVFIPLILAGRSVYAVGFTVCLYIIAMTLALVNGINTKSLCAALGCASGLLVAGLVVGVMDQVFRLTGFVNEESVFLLNMNVGAPLDIKAVLLTGILIGALGAVLDVAVSMASSLEEVRDTAEQVSFSSLLRSGMNIGQDMMGTMSNTLVLAYIGGSLSTTLLLFAYSNSVLELLNREIIVTEILRAVSGSIGLLCAIPLTALFCAWFYTREPRRKRELDGQR